MVQHNGRRGREPLRLNPYQASQERLPVRHHRSSPPLASWGSLMIRSSSATQASLNASQETSDSSSGLACPLRLMMAPYALSECLQIGVLRRWPCHEGRDPRYPFTSMMSRSRVIPWACPPWIRPGVAGHPTPPLLPEPRFWRVPSAWDTSMGLV
jgi:hypothetical protein